MSSYDELEASFPDFGGDLAHYPEKSTTEQRRALYRAACAEWEKQGVVSKLTHKTAAEMVQHITGCDLYDILWSGDEGKVSPEILLFLQARGWTLAG